MKKAQQVNTLFADKMQKAVAEQRSKKPQKPQRVLQNVNAYGKEGDDHLNFSAISRISAVRHLASDNVHAFINPALGKFMMLEGLDYYLHCLDEAARYFERRVKPGSMREPSVVRTRKAVLAHQIYTHLMALPEQDRQWLYDRLDLPFLSYSENRMGFRLEEKDREDYLRLVRDVLTYTAKGEMFALLQKLSKGKGKNIYRQLAPKAVVSPEDLMIYTDAEYAAKQKEAKAAEEKEAGVKTEDIGSMQIHWLDLYQKDWKNIDPASGVEYEFVPLNVVRNVAHADVYALEYPRMMAVIDQTPVVFDAKSARSGIYMLSNPRAFTSQLPCSEIARHVIDTDSVWRVAVDVSCIVIQESEELDQIVWKGDAHEGNFAMGKIIDTATGHLPICGSYLQIVGVGVALTGVKEVAA